MVLMHVQLIPGTNVIAIVRATRLTDRRLENFRHFFSNFLRLIYPSV